MMADMTATDRALAAIRAAGYDDTQVVGESLRLVRDTKMVPFLHAYGPWQPGDVVIPVPPMLVFGILVETPMGFRVDEHSIPFSDAPDD